MVFRMGYQFVQRVALLRRRSDRAEITIILPVSHSPVLWISQGWSTLLMNYITSAGACVLHSDLTFASMALISPAWLDSEGKALASIGPCIRQLQEHGFVFHERLASVPSEHRASAAPNRLRTAEDAHSFVVVFPTGSLKTDQRFTPEFPDASWTLGGWIGPQLRHGKATLTIQLVYDDENSVSLEAERWTYHAGGSYPWYEFSQCEIPASGRVTIRGDESWELRVAATRRDEATRADSDA